MPKGREPHDRIVAGGRRRPDGSDEGSLSSSGGEESWHSTKDSKQGSGSNDECRLGGGSDPEIGAAPELRRESSESDCCSDVDLESGVPKIEVHLAKAEKDCRICHLSLESANQESGIPIELGCSCKDDLAAAHKQCAEAWFKIKGNKTDIGGVQECNDLVDQVLYSNSVCLPSANIEDIMQWHRHLGHFPIRSLRTCEICGTTARNVVTATEAEIIEQLSETSNAAATPPTDTRSFWHGHRFLNFLLACMVFAFVISWLLHFNVPS